MNGRFLWPEEYLRQSGLWWDEDALEWLVLRNMGHSTTASSIKLPFENLDLKHGEWCSVRFMILMYLLPFDQTGSRECIYICIKN